MKHEITIKCERELHNWGKFCRQKDRGPAGYPAVQPMFREVNSGKSAASNKTNTIVDDASAEKIDRIVRQCCTSRLERESLTAQWVDRASTWAVVAGIASKRIGCTVSRSAAREAVQRAEARVDAVLIERAGNGA